MTPKQSAPELLGEYLEANRGDYCCVGIYMVPEGDVSDVKDRTVEEWLIEMGPEFIRNADAIVIGMDDHLLVIRDRYRDTPYRIFGENAHV